MPWPNLEVETSEIRRYLTEPAEDDLDTDEGTGSPSYTNKIEESLVVPETPNRWIEDLTTPEVVCQDITDIVPPVEVLPVNEITMLLASREEILPEVSDDVSTIVASTTNQEIVEDIPNEGGRHKVEQERITPNEDRVPVVQNGTSLDSKDTHSTEPNETTRQDSSSKVPDQETITFSSCKRPFTIDEKRRYDCKRASSSSENSISNLVDDLENQKSDGPGIDHTELTTQERREEIIKRLSNHNTNIPDIINPDVIITVDQPHNTILGKGVSSPANKDDQTLPNVIHSNEQGEHPLESSTETNSQTSIAESTIRTSSSDKSNPRDEIDHEESDSFTHSFPNQTPSTPITPVAPQLKDAEHAGSRSLKSGADSGDSIGKISPRNKGKEKGTMDNRSKREVHKRTKPVFSGKKRANRQFERKSQDIESGPDARRPEEVFSQSRIMERRINERPNVYTSWSGVQQEEFVWNSPEPSTSITQSPIGSTMGVPDSSEKEDRNNDMIEAAEEYPGIAHSVPSTKSPILSLDSPDRPIDSFDRDIATSDGERPFERIYQNGSNPDEHLPYFNSPEPRQSSNSVPHSTDPVREDTSGMSTDPYSEESERLLEGDIVPSQVVPHIGTTNGESSQSDLLPNTSKILHESQSTFKEFQSYEILDHPDESLKEEGLFSSGEASPVTSISESTIQTSDSSHLVDIRDKIDYQQSDSFTHSFPNQTPSIRENPNFDTESSSTTKPDANQGFFAPLPWPNLEVETSGTRRDLTEPDGESERNLSSGEESEFEDESDEDDNLKVLNSSPQTAEVQPTRSEVGYEGDSEEESEEEFRFEDGENSRTQLSEKSEESDEIDSLDHVLPEASDDFSDEGVEQTDVSVQSLEIAQKPFGFYKLLTKAREYIFGSRNQDELLDGESEPNLSSSEESGFEKESEFEEETGKYVDPNT
ncbi:hypothetical protein NEOLI_005036, partial [Neolecta irregularis DAH-3]